MAFVGTPLGLVLRGAPVGLLSVGPGLLDEDSMPRAFIFDASQSWGAENPLRRFYAEELGELDWLRDYLGDTRLMASLKDDEEFVIRGDDELEDTYQKDALTNIDSDAGWADG